MNIPDPTPPRVSICIPTRNRKDALIVCLESCLAQDYRPLEIIVYDDASTDGTPGEVKRLFPEILCISTRKRVGQAGLRDRGFRDCHGDFVFSLDDDAYFSDTGTILRTLSDFQNDPGIGGVAIPFIEPIRRASHEQAPLSPHDNLRSFYGCAYAIRRATALACGGYRAFFQAHVEERDLCIRILDHGGGIIYGSAPPVVHMVHPTGERPRVQYLGVRNTLLFDYLNIPQPYVVQKYVMDMARLFVHKLTLFSAPRRLFYVLAGVGACLRYLLRRHAVSRATYKKFIRLPGHSPLSCAGPLPPPARRPVQHR